MTGGLQTNVLIHRALYTQYKEEKPPSIYDKEKDRKQLGHQASCLRGSASDNGPRLVLDQSGLAKVTDQIEVAGTTTVARHGVGGGVGVRGRRGCDDEKTDKRWTGLRACNTEKSSGRRLRGEWVWQFERRVRAGVGGVGGVRVWDGVVLSKKEVRCVSVSYLGFFCVGANV
ncbi:hypothetical protein PIB30_051578 [Stylosanthes scabra]|uniref:Uncharacterized protein n=1 Tax=Stylosanthes scabra TaxID=79078 RepID=A0ABU6TK28_9FABA|nr:hypothetical protein [Stylosanthes scabra]